MLADYLEALHNGEATHNGMERGCYVNLPNTIKWFCDRYQILDEENYVEQLQNITESLEPEADADDMFLSQSTRIIEDVRNLCTRIQEEIERKSAGPLVNVDGLPEDWQI